MKQPRAIPTFPLVVLAQPSNVSQSILYVPYDPKIHVLILTSVRTSVLLCITPSYSVLECFLSSMALPVAKINY